MFPMNTEAAILCASCNGDDDLETTKAYYVAQAYAASQKWRVASATSGTVSWAGETRTC